MGKGAQEKGNGVKKIIKATPYMHARRLTAGIYTGLLLLLVGCFVPWAHADTRLSASPNQASYSLVPYSTFWHADEQTATLRDVLSQAPHFEQAHDPEDLNFGYTQQDVWLRTQVHNDSLQAQRWIVQFEYPFLDHVTLYTLAQSFNNMQRSGEAATRFPLNSVRSPIAKRFSRWS